MVQYTNLILIVAFLIYEIASQSPCLLYDTTNPNLCLMCSIGYYQNQQTSFEQSFVPANCLLASNSYQTISFYVTSTSTCTITCDGSQKKPFQNILQALTQIPYPVMPMSQTPNVTIFIQDQTTYILDSYISTQQVTYYNRRVPINLIILPDPNKVLIKPIIYIKTERFSIFVASSLQIQGFIISGLGMNELPSSYTNQAQIFCTETLQKQFNNPIAGTMNCGIKNNSLVQLSNEQESYGLFVIEPLFDLVPLVYPTITIQGCIIQDFYPIENQRFVSFIKIGLQLPSNIIIKDSQFNNIFFEQGIISSIYWKNWLWYQLQLSLNTLLLKAYGQFQIYQSVSIQFSNVVITGYNNLRINNVEGFSVLTGAIVTIADQPLNLNLKSTIFNSSNVTDPSTNPDTNLAINAYVYELDGVSYGHYSTILYTSTVVVYDKYHIPLMSNLLVNQLTYDQVGYNAAIIFHATTDPVYFLNPLNTIHNQIQLNGLTCTNSFLRFVLIHSNADFFVSHNFINNISTNFIYYSTVFSSFNYQQFYNLTTTVVDNIDSFYVGDEINELNCVLYNDNATTITPVYPIYITIQDCTFQNMVDMVIFEGRNQRPIETHIYNINLFNHTQVNLVWGLFGSFFQQLTLVENITISQSKIWELVTSKQVPPRAVYSNIHLSKSYIYTLITFRGSVRTLYNWTHIINNFTSQYTDEECQSKQYWMSTIIKDNARREDLSLLKGLGTFIIQNSNIKLCSIRTALTSIYSQSSPWNKVITSTNFNSYGPAIIFFFTQSFVSPIQQSFSSSNSVFYRYDEILDPPKSQWDSTDYADQTTSDFFIDFDTTYINFNNCSFYDTGYRYAKIRITNSLGGIIQNVSFYNFGLQLISPLNQLSLNYVTMKSSNRNQSSTFFVLLQQSIMPVWINNKQIKTGTLYCDLIVNNSFFYGNLTNGIFQLTNTKIYIENSIIATKDIYLDQLQLNNIPIPQNLIPVTSPITLKSYGWIYLNNSQMYNCSTSTNNKMSCIEAFKTAIVETYDSKFKNSKSSFGSFIYGFKVSIYLQNCFFENGEANKGGSIYLISSTLNILGGTFSRSSSIYTGGHIYAEDSSISIDSTIFQYGYSKDSGSSIYGDNSVQLFIINTQFLHMQTVVQAVLYSSSQNQITNVHISNTIFQNCSSSSKTIALYIYKATLFMQNVQFDNQRLQIINNEKIQVLKSIISLINVTHTLNQINYIACQTQLVMSFSNTQGSLTNVSLQSTYFDKYVFYLTTSAITIIQFNLTLLDDQDFILQLQNRDQFTLSQQDRKTIFFSQQGSILLIQNSVISQQLIVSMPQVLESRYIIKQIISGIQSINSNIQVTNTVFQDQYLTTNQLFTNTSQTQKHRVLQNVDSQGVNQASSLDVQGGQLYLFNCSFPSFAVNCPIVQISNSEFNISSITNKDSGYMTKSIIYSYCQGPYIYLCLLTDYQFIYSSQVNPNGVYTLQDSSFESYGITINFTSILGYTPNVNLNNLQLKSRQGESNTTPIYISDSNIQIKNVYISSYSQPLTITQSSVVSFTNGYINNGQNGGIQIYGGIVNIKSIIFDSNTAFNGGALYSECQKLYKNQITLNNCSFTNNLAQQSGGAIRNVNCPLQIDNTTFNNNQAAYGLDFLGFPQSIILHQILILSNQSIQNLANLSSNISHQALDGQNIQNQTLYVVGGQIATFVMNVVDNFGQIYPLGSYFSSKQLQQVIRSVDTMVTVELKATDQNIKVTLVSYSFELISNAIIITEFYAFAKENYIGTLGYNLVEVFIDSNSLGTFQLVILPCPQGSISSSDRCFMCPNNTYSLNSSDQKCFNCNKYLSCKGKNYLFADEGYYLSVNTSNPQSCTIMNACYQQIISNDKLDIIFLISHYNVMVPNQTFQQLLPFISNSDMQIYNSTKQNYCASGYQGAFCSTCQAGYGQTSDGFCYQCSTSQTIYIKFIVSFLIVLAINYKDSVEPLSAEDEDRPLLSQVILKQLTDFTQFVNIIVSMISNVSPSILPVLSTMSNQVSLFPTDFRSGFDCIFLQNVNDPLQKFKYQLVVSSLIPWGFLFALIIMILIIDKIKKFIKSESIPSYVTLVDLFIVTMVANLYNFYFFLAQICLNLFSCIQLNDSTQQSGQITVLAVMTNLQCWQQDHLYLILTYALPTLFIYVIGIPCMFAFFISKYYKENDVKTNDEIDSEKQQFIKKDEDQKNQVDFAIAVPKLLKHKSHAQRQISKEGDKIIYDNQNQDGKESPSLNQEVIEASISNKGSPDGSYKSQLKQMSLREDQTTVRYSVFLTENLKPEYKYWGIYVQFKKLLIISLMILTQSLNVATASIIVLIVFIIFMLVSYKHQPYLYKQLNIYESANDLLLTIIIHLSLLIVQSNTEGIQVIAVVFIIILKFGFYYYGFKIIIFEYLQYIRKLGEEMSKKKQQKTIKSMEEKSKLSMPQ